MSGRHGTHRQSAGCPLSWKPGLDMTQPQVGGSGSRRRAWCGPGGRPRQTGAGVQASVLSSGSGAANRVPLNGTALIISLTGAKEGSAANSGANEEAQRAWSSG